MAALLGRLPVDLDVDAHSSYVRGATILVTGAGGSIGRELCARLVGLRARRLILVDQAEAPLLELAAALRQEHGVVDVVAVLADVRSEARAAAVFEEHTPDVVFHAAAYKQVPLLEAHPLEGVATNVLGTKSVVDAAVRVGAARFVLFSSDKAVRPSNVLGRTKALAECVVAAGGRQACQGGYVAVRLGNVVDSSGSILPLFRRQVERGGPITVTHPQMTRYFITVREAAALAIVAGGIGEANEAFCLDAGPPVRIVDIAQRFADAAAVDVSIDFVGVRAGERMHESLFWSDDDVFETRCRRVLGSPLPAVDPAAVAWWLAELARHVQTASTADVLGVLAEATVEPRASDALPDAVALQ